MITKNQNTEVEDTILPFILSFELSDLDALYKAYMPFINGGGLFVPTTDKHQLGDAIMLSLTLPHTTQEQMVPGTVVWITPPGAQTGTPMGIGIQFNETEQNKALSIWIRNALVDYPQTDQPSDTF